MSTERNIEKYPTYVLLIRQNKYSNVLPNVKKLIDVDGKYAIAIFKESVSSFIKQSLGCVCYSIEEIPRSIKNAYFKTEYFYREVEPKIKLNTKAVNRLIKGHLGL